MATFKVFHKGSYYKFSSVPVSYAHLLKVLTKLPEASPADLYFCTPTQEILPINSEASFRSALTLGSTEVVLYTEYPSSDLIDYVDLQKSLIFNPEQGITELIRQELRKDQPKMPHLGFQCSNCAVEPIKGIRYFCQVCKISFCEICEEIEKVHNHLLLKIKKVENVKGEVLNEGMMKRKEEAPKAPKVSFDVGGKNEERKEVGKKPEEHPRYGKMVFQNVKKLQDLGFNDVNLNRTALESCGYDLEAAINYIINHS